MKDKKKPIRVLKNAVRLILTSWLILKLIAALITFFSWGGVDLTFMNPAVELGFQSLVFIKSTTMGLIVFICFVVVTAVGLPMSFLIMPDGRAQNISGWIAYSILILTDIGSAFLIGVKDGVFVVSLVMSLLIAACLAVYLKWFLIDPAKNDSDGEEAENIS